MIKVSFKLIVFNTYSVINAANINILYDTGTGVIVCASIARQCPTAGRAMLAGQT